MRMQAKKPATYDDLVALPEGLLGQILDGELVATPRPALEHGRIASTLTMELGPPFQRGHSGPGGWWFVVEPELHLGRDILVPDLAAWRVARMPEPPSGPFTALAPDWICEVLSPSTALLDRDRKLPIYAREQVQHAWLVDPSARRLEAFRRGPGELWRPIGTWSGNERVRVEPFEAIELELSGLWPLREHAMPR